MSGALDRTGATAERVTVTLDEAGLVTLAGAMAGVLLAGDCITLRGELGTGKTTFARALIRALVGDAGHDVPSPTFALRQDYTGPKCPIVHVDFYRIGEPREVDELALDDAFEAAIVIVEWPEMAPDAIPTSYVELALSEQCGGAARQVVVSGFGSCVARVVALRSVFGAS